MRPALEAEGMDPLTLGRLTDWASPVKRAMGCTLNSSGIADTEVDFRRWMHR